MSIRLLTISLLGMLFAINAHAVLIAQEQALELSTMDVRLPENGAGNTLVVRQCPGCPPMLLRIQTETEHYIDDRRVSYKELRALARTLDAAGLYVFYEPETNEITRIVLDT